MFMLHSFIIIPPQWKLVPGKYTTYSCLGDIYLEQKMLMCFEKLQKLLVMIYLGTFTTSAWTREPLMGKGSHNALLYQIMHFFSFDVLKAKKNVLCSNSSLKILYIPIWSGSSGLVPAAGIADQGRAGFRADWFTSVLTGRWLMLCSIQNDVCTSVYSTWVSVRKNKRCSLPKGPHCNSQDLLWGDVWRTQRLNMERSWAVAAVNQKKKDLSLYPLSHEMSLCLTQNILCAVY